MTAEHTVTNRALMLWKHKHDSVSILYHTHCDDAAMYYNTVAAVHHCILRGTYGTECIAVIAMILT